MLKKVLDSNWLTIIGVVIIANVLGDFLGATLFDYNETYETRWIRVAFSAIGILYFAFPFNKTS